jgi:hypothetical protein
VYWFTLGALSVWRITHFFHAEDGPADVSVRLRLWVGNGFIGNVLDCFYCLSVWVALPLAAVIGETWRERILLWPALSAAAILMERVTNREKETQHVVLREQETTVAYGTPLHAADRKDDTV